MRRPYTWRAGICVLVLLFGLGQAGCDGASPRTDPRSPSPTAGSPDALAGVSPAVREFLSGDPERPFGQPGVGAPPENAFFAALVGVWACRIQFNDNGVVRSGYPATWAFKFSAGGYAIEHLYYQRKDNLAPPLAPIGRDYHAVALVQYDPKIGAWRFVAASNLAGSPVGASTQVMTGRLANGALTFEPDVQDMGSLRTRDIFHSVETDRFVWTQRESSDGRAWKHGVSIVCQRRVAPPDR